MMKKFFTFGSSSTSESIQVPPPVEKKINSGGTLKSELENQSSAKVSKSFQSSDKVFSNIENPSYEKRKSDSNSRLRRSLSFSSVDASNDNNGELDRIKPNCFGNQNLSSSSSFSNVPQQPNSSSRCRSLTPVKKVKPNDRSHQIEKGRLHKPHNDSSQNSSSSSVLDLYIDGEHQQEKIKSKNISSKRNHTPKGRPPRVQYTEPPSPRNDLKGRQRSHSFRDVGATQFYSSKDWAEGDFRQESQYNLLNVIEKLSQPQSRVSLKSDAVDFDHDSPILIEDIYEAYVTDDSLGFPKQDLLPAKNFYSVDNRDDALDDLQRKFNEAKERASILSEEFEQERFLQDTGHHVSSLIQKIRSLAEDRISLAFEVSWALQGQIDDRISVKENLRKEKADCASRILRVEKEKVELQSSLERELDRRSSEWSSKLEKYQSEEHRLMERVRELAEQNVSLQREVSFLNDKMSENSNIATRSELEIRDLTSKLEESNHENHTLGQNLSCLQEKLLTAESELGLLRRSSFEMEKESEDLQNSVARLLRACSQQEKTICGLREVLDKRIQNRSNEREVEGLQIEHLRLTGIEQALRKEVESQRSEVNSLRNENISLLNRLKLGGKEMGFSTFKLDQELCNRVCCLQNQGLALMRESTQLCSKLLEFTKNRHLDENAMSGVDKQFVRDSDVKVKGLHRGTENLARSLNSMSEALQEKSNMTVHVESSLIDKHHSEEMIMLEIKARSESLLRSLLSEKLFSQEMELKQLRAELAAAVRGNDNLKCEIQNGADDLINATYKWKNLELEMASKRRVENELDEAANELRATKGKMSKVSKERDLMWDEMKKYSEENMLLKKKVEALEDDVLVKEGQITILKESLDSKTFSFLSSP